MTLPANMLREIYARADPRTQVRLRAVSSGTRALFSNRPAPKMPAKMLTDRLRKVHGRALTLYHAMTYRAPELLYPMLGDLTRMVQAVPAGAARGDAAPLATLLRAQMHSDPFSNEAPADHSSDTAFVFSYLRAVDSYVNNVSRRVRLSNAHRSRAARDTRSHLKNLRQRTAMFARVDGAADRARRRSQRRGQRLAQREAQRRTAQVAQAAARTLAPGSVPFAEMRAAPQRPLSNAIRTSAQHPAVTGFTTRPTVPSV